MEWRPGTAALPGSSPHDSVSVRIATMHRAKGLEFDEVVLLLNEPREAWGSADTDRRRLHHVAITRAEKLATVIRVG